jgi:hypothetical protein
MSSRHDRDSFCRGATLGAERSDGLGVTRFLEVLFGIAHEAAAANSEDL